MTKKDELVESIYGVVNKVLETYFPKHNQRPVLRVYWKFMSALFGSLTFVAIASWGTSGPFGRTDGLFPIWSNGNSQSEYVRNFFYLITVTFPIVMSLLIATSIRNGRPLRFYFAGFFFSSLVFLVSY